MFLVIWAGKSGMSQHQLFDHRSVDRSVAISLSKLPQRHFVNIENYRFKIRSINLLHLNVVTNLLKSKNLIA